MIGPETSQKLLKTAQDLYAHYKDCRLCPWKCGIDRSKGKSGPCRSPAYASLAAYAVHHGEEPPISGTRGTGNLFFSGCSMSCVYCQNFEISQETMGPKPTSPEDIGRAIHALAQDNVHNIGLVSASHILPDAIMGLYHAALKGVHLPVVYNTNSFENVETLKKLHGIVDIYLADLRYSNDMDARKFSKTRNYVHQARQAIIEMARQVGPSLQIGPDNIAIKGLIVRMLVLPNDIAGIKSSLQFLKTTFGNSVTISIMAQYQPMYKASDYPFISRRLYYGEYLRALDLAESMGFKDIYVQSMDAAENYIPSFRNGTVSFSERP